MPDQTWEVPTANIFVGDRLRPVDAAWVASLQVAIEESGWFGSILIRPFGDAGEGGEQRYKLVVGAHRLAAMRGLGRFTIPSTIRVLTDDEAEQIEIDENLIRRGLTPLERAEMVAARFVVWSRRFPERATSVDGEARPKRGRPSNSAKFAEFPGGGVETMGFATETAAEVGLSRRTIEEAWATVNRLPPELRNRLRGTPVAKNAGLLRQLAGMGDKAEQAKVAEHLISGQARNVSEGRAIAAGNSPSRLRPKTEVDATLKAFRTLLKSCTPTARLAVLEEARQLLAKRDSRGAEA